MMSHVETASSAGGDQSDLEIRVNTLQEDLSRRMKTAARLKKEQKSARRERLKVKVMNVGSDTFGNPVFQKVILN